MNKQHASTSSANERATAFGDSIATLITLFVPGEDDEWAWWPDGHNFYQEWDAGVLAQLALDTAFQSSVDQLPQETLDQAIAIAEQGLDILAACEVVEPYLPFRLLLVSLENEVLRDLGESASVLVGCFELGEMLSRDHPHLRADTIAEELYGASNDWAIPLTFSLVGLKLRLLGPAFEAAMRAWYEQLLIQARAHYLQSESPKEHGER